MQLFLSGAVILLSLACQATGNDKFLYFAYGSNLLHSRIHIRNPTAVFKSSALLPGYRLDFNMYTPDWRGAVATIVEDPRSAVWGALWFIDLDKIGDLDKENRGWEMKRLANKTFDEKQFGKTRYTLMMSMFQFNQRVRQEGVPVGEYYATNVTVTEPDGTASVARTYIETQNPAKLEPGQTLPPERRPSNTYMQVIIYGAIECKLPANYIDFLYTFPTNGDLASNEIRQHLGYPFNSVYNDTMQL